MIENLKTVLFLKKWAIHGLPFFIIVFSKQMLHKKFADDWNWTTDLWCRKRPLYQLSHNHCPKTVLLRTNFWTNFFSQDSLTCSSFWENMRPHLNDKKLNWNKHQHFYKEYLLTANCPEKGKMYEKRLGLVHFLKREMGPRYRKCLLSG